MSLESRLEALEGRLQEVEDVQAIARILRTYGRLVDSGSSEGAADLWTDDGFLEVTDYPGRMSRGDISKVLGGPQQLQMNSHGCMHFIISPKITIKGDSAEAVTYNLVVLRYEGNVSIWRAVVNYWVFIRQPIGWKVTERYVSPVDGSDEAQRLIKIAKDMAS
jgi:hypothetical protein